MFLNREQAQAEEERTKVIQMTQALAQVEVAEMRQQAMEALLRVYANRIVELEIRIAMLEACNPKE